MIRCCVDNRKSDGGRRPQPRRRSWPMAGRVGGVAGPGRRPVSAGGATCERVGGERHAHLRLRGSRRTVRGEVRWRDDGDLLHGASGRPDHRPHPYHGSVAKRRASQCLRSSRRTVGGEGMCSDAQGAISCRAVDRAGPDAQAQSPSARSGRRNALPCPRCVRGWTLGSRGRSCDGPA
jgi:hypothetical protein